jgi:type IV pilus assembly protein PilY1
MTAHRQPPMLHSMPQAARLLAAALALVATPGVQAALTGIADEPLITQAEFQPKPNLMVILDDSGSMVRSYMPDELGSSTDTNDSGGKTTWLGYRSAQCNGVGYNPNYKYVPPLTSTGTVYADANFTAAKKDGFSTSSSATNLGTNSSNSFLTVSATGTGNIASGANVLTVTSTMAATLGAKSFVVGDAITLVSGTAKAPLTASGTVAAWSHTGNGTGSLTVNITTVPKNAPKTATWTVTFPGEVFYTYNGKEGAVNPAAMAWTYTTNGVIKTTDFYKQCIVTNTTASSTADAGVFELNVVSSNSSAVDKTNYANWYSYYRTRMLMMRTAMGRAISPLDDAYRIGFMQINKASQASGTTQLTFRPVTDFNAAQKSLFYTSLYSAAGTSMTPLRGALSTAGRYFANNLSKQSTDPMQYACQRNIALLTTDGYWYEDDGKFGLGSTTIGNADSGTGRPYQDSHSDTLADVAHYYYTTDLRTTELKNCTGANNQDVCANILTPSGKDTATHQHMTTFTIGMGVVGTVAASTPLNSINWPKPVSNTITAVDDMWHAAINGRGENYSAQNASELSEAIESVVKTVQDTLGAGTATSTSTLDLVKGDGNVAFEASYTTGSWYGDVVARELNGTTAEVSTGAPLWSARDLLNAKTAASRTIYFKDGANLSAFTWDNLNATLRGHFQNLCSATPAKLTQCEALNTANQTTVNDGAELVAYLRGDRTKEAKSTNTTAPLFRERKFVLGDIVNSKPIHVGKAPFDYTDAGYAAFKSSQASRKKVVYVGANDGMLHALDAATGEELWAYMPTAVMPNLYRLADAKYGTNTSQPHTYFVDGKAVQGDVKIGTTWKTILVGGLNKGGRAYYALDITNPDAPQALWEFTNDNLGLTYSDPVISKLADGTWTVAFGSGYNNVSPGDGQGRLFMVNAANGAVLRNIPTTAGSTATPSGMSKVNVWVKALNDNTAQRFYAGDLLGNVWRFDVDNLVLPHKDALLLAQMQDASGTGQPITTELKLREYDKQPVVVAATGRYLGRDDIDDQQVQSIAAIRDPMTGTGWGVVRTNTSKFKKVTITKSGTTANGPPVTVDWATGGGWWADFPTNGERMSMPMEWDGARLLAATTIPDGNQCKSGGASWLYSFGLANGTTKAEEFSDSALIVGFSVVRNDEGDPKIIVRTSDNKTEVKDGSGLGGATTIKRARRVSWRELP